LLVLFGADEQLLPLAKRYLIPIRYTVPVFLFTQFLSAFLRNDSDPQLATKAVLSGGAFNVIGDYLLVFTFDMGIFGAGLATAISSIVSLLVMMTHFLRRTNTLKSSDRTIPQRAEGLCDRVLDVLHRIAGNADDAFNGRSCVFQGRRNGCVWDLVNIGKLCIGAHMSRQPSRRFCRSTTAPESGTACPADSLQHGRGFASAALVARYATVPRASSTVHGSHGIGAGDRSASSVRTASPSSSCR
jgi:hypothetical protein